MALPSSGSDRSAWPGGRPESDTMRLDAALGRG